MLTVYSDDHRLRDSKTELYGGQLVPPFECPARMDRILERIGAVGLGEVVPPRTDGMAVAARLHDADYLAFLAECWRDWSAAGYAGEAIASGWPARRMRQRAPTEIDGRIGYYALAAETAISAGTWEAAQASAGVAASGQKAVAEGAKAVFALCRPPGHHATRDMFGGYCFLNNAAIAAQGFRDDGAARVAVLDVDFHHGNGTQDIFYDRGDVLFVSLHGAQEHAFPYFLGYADETGAGAGEGATVNLPMPPGTGYDRWSEALEAGCDAVGRFGAEALVVSLGADTFKGDPISFFRLESDDFRTMGQRIARLGLPTLFVMEGGYAVDDLGVNTVNVLTGFEAG